MKGILCVSVRQRPWHRSATWGLMGVLRVQQRLPMMCMKTVKMRMRWRLEQRQPDTSDKACTMLLIARNFDHLGKDQSMSSLLLCVVLVVCGSFVNRSLLWALKIISFYLVKHRGTFFYPLSSQWFFCHSDRNGIRPVISTVRAMFLAYHDSMVAACCLQVKNIVFLTGGMLPWSRRARQSTQPLQCSWPIISAWWHAVQEHCHPSVSSALIL